MQFVAKKIASLLKQNILVIDSTRKDSTRKEQCSSCGTDWTIQTYSNITTSFLLGSYIYNQ